LIVGQQQVTFGYDKRENYTKNVGYTNSIELFLAFTKSMDGLINLLDYFLQSGGFALSVM